MINANITNCSQVHIGNFHIKIFLNADVETLDMNNLIITPVGDTDISGLSFNLSGSNRFWTLEVENIGEGVGEFDVELTGQVKSLDKLQDVVAKKQRFCYDTRKLISVVFGDMVRNEDQSITIPVEFEDVVLGINKRYFDIKTELPILSYYLTGTGKRYTLTLRPVGSGSISVCVKKSVLTLNNILMETNGKTEIVV